MVNLKADCVLRQAIAEKRLISFEYNGLERVAEPHDYGRKNGSDRLLTYQIGGKSGSGKLPAWRMVDVDRIQHVKLLDARFTGSRRQQFTHHHAWEVLYARVS